MNEFLETIKWDSEEQRKACMAFVYWCRKHDLPSELRPADLFLFQQIHELNEYWRDVVETQVKSLQTEIIALRKEISR
jgi:hypothetical protein